MAKTCFSYTPHQEAHLRTPEISRESTKEELGKVLRGLRSISTSYISTTSYKRDFSVSHLQPRNLGSPGRHSPCPPCLGVLQQASPATLTMSCQGMCSPSSLPCQACHSPPHREDIWIEGSGPSKKGPNPTSSQALEASLCPRNLRPPPHSPRDTLRKPGGKSKRDEPQQPTG